MMSVASTYVDQPIIDTFGAGAVFYTATDWFGDPKWMHRALRFFDCRQDAKVVAFIVGVTLHFEALAIGRI